MVIKRIHVEIAAPRSLLVTPSGKPLNDEAVKKLLKSIPKKWKPPVRNWLLVKPFTLVKSLPGGGYAAYRIEWSGTTNKRIVKVTPKVFKDRFGWSILVHECMHAVLFQEHQTHAMLKNGDLLLRLLGQNPRDPKFKGWKAKYSDENNNYQTTLANGDDLAKMLDLGISGGKWKSDTYMLGNYIETVPMGVQLLANGLYKTINKKSGDKLTDLFKWINDRYKSIGSYPIS
ncbi:hypothetical protein GR11A_00022 [Vibrio phage vB_VcorM_GR11A]|nr:hypothetical protein GR11A_00022 [Vibrio phage vB_VcorM_GR11A]